MSRTGERRGLLSIPTHGRVGGRSRARGATRRREDCVAFSPTPVSLGLSSKRIFFLISIFF